MYKINLDTTLNLNIVDKLVSQYHTKDICIVIPNTKKQSSEELKKIARKYPNLTISVTGGLDPKKNKFNNEHYQKRTYYTPNELSEIVHIFNIIERKMDISWTDREKAMFYYMELCNKMEYSECTVNGRDNARNLLGLLHKKAVCSGFALIYKEALDRLNIPNYYQNREGHHSWNIAYIDGAYRAMELTWDVSLKKEDGCAFHFFNREDDFYGNKHHDISYESEEKKYPIKSYSEQELIESLEKILNYKIKKRVEVTGAVKIKKDNDYIVIENKDGVYRIHGKGIKRYKRIDNSYFALVEYGKYKDLNRYIYIDFTDSKHIELSKIYSDEELTKMDSRYDDDIANGLLSKERVNRKLREFNGYVGYVSQGHGIIYNTSIENKLNIYR